MLYLALHNRNLIFWNQARGQKRRVGWFPANYVKLLSSSARTTPDPQGGSGTGTTSPVKSLTMPHGTTVSYQIQWNLGCYAKSLYIQWYGETHIITDLSRVTEYSRTHSSMLGHPIQYNLGCYVNMVKSLDIQWYRRTHSAIMGHLIQ